MTPFSIPRRHVAAAGWVRRGIATVGLVALTSAPICGQTLPVEAGIKDGVGDGRVSPFYTWSKPLPARPGVMLRTEPLPGDLGLVDAGEQTRILYTSTDGVAGRGIVAVSGAIFMPKGTAPAGGWPVIAWSHGTVGIADACAPSWNARSYRDSTYLNAWLRRGYAIVATDYQGLGTPGTHPYIQTRVAAYGVLDSIRAAQTADRRLSKKVVVLGQSQGGGAAFATATIQASYAPDIELKGAVGTGTPYITPASITQDTGVDPQAVDPTLAYLFYLAWTAAPAATVDAAFSARARPVVAAARSTCIMASEMDVLLAGLSRANTIQLPGMIAVLRGAMPALVYSTLKPAVPVFLGAGTQDKDVPIAGQRKLAKDACEAGAIIDYHEYAGADHSGAFTTSLPDAFAFVDAVMTEKPTASTCNVAATS